MTVPTRLRVLVLAALVAAALAPALARADDPAPALPPGQPAAGPHGADYAYASFTRDATHDGYGGFTLYLPAGPIDGGVPSHPVVLLMRGACPTSCNQTETNNMLNTWREHLLRKGFVVVFPHYQDANGDDHLGELSRVMGALDTARSYLAESGVPVDWSRFGVAGHSRGSQMTWNYTVGRANLDVLRQQPGFTLDPAVADLPAPAWLLVVEPGPTSNVLTNGDDDAFTVDLAAAFAHEPRAIIAVGEDDTLAGDAKARVLHDALAPHLAAEHRDYVEVRSDRRGPWALAPTPVRPLCDPVTEYPALVLAACLTTQQAWSLVPRYNEARNLENPASATGDLVADHFFPGGGNALDVWALWKLSVGLDACTSGGDCSVVTPGPAMAGMGEWSDRTPVEPLCVTDDPDAC